jgi:hypothetical protein
MPISLYEKNPGLDMRKGLACSLISQGPLEYPHPCRGYRFFTYKQKRMESQCLRTLPGLYVSNLRSKEKSTIPTRVSLPFKVLPGSMAVSRTD